MDKLLAVALIVSILGQIAALALVVIARERAEIAWRRQVERLERIVASENVMEAAAAERLYESPPTGIETPKPEPDELDLMFADPPRRKEKKT